MKKILLLLATLFIFTGCGGGGGDSDNTPKSEQTTNTQDTASNQPSSDSIDTWSYVVPNSNTVKSRGLNDTYSANFRSIDNSTVVETPQNTVDEKVEYKNLSDKITISFYKNDKKTFSYNLKKNLYIGEQTTIEKSACMLVNHFQQYTINNTKYQDVIEIDCGKHKGFYAKGKGEIAKK